MLQDFPPVKRGPEVHKEEDEDEDDGQDQRHLHQRLPPLGPGGFPRGSELPPTSWERSGRPPRAPARGTSPCQATVRLHLAAPAIPSPSCRRPGHATGSGLEGLAGSVALEVDAVL